MRVFDFEVISPDLELMPLAARRAADLAGLKPSLVAWRSLPLPSRQALTQLGSELAVDVARAATLLSEAAPLPARSEPLLEQPERGASNELLAALGADHPLPVTAWSGLSLLERYALEKTARKGRSERLLQAYAELVGVSATAPHLDAQGSARMVAVSLKEPSLRRAVASSRVTMNSEAFARLERADAPKGDVLGTARLAGILGAKRTSELVPLCHPLSLTRVDLVLSIDAVTRSVAIEARVEAFDRTGVEMEALTAASIAALTVYDMLKAFDRAMEIGPTRLREKTGGRSDFHQAEPADRFAVRAEVLEPAQVLAQVARPEAGASVLFAGVVRDHNEGQAVTALEYQAYASMAVREMQRIAADIERESPGVRLAVQHRVGALKVGDTAVLCAASAAHRDAAFRACRALIDRVKQSVPVWKREHTAAGPYWVGWEDARRPASASSEQE